MIKYFRILRQERARKKREKALKEEQKKIEKEKREREHQQLLELAKKDEFLLHYSPNIYFNKIRKNLEDYDLRSVEVIYSDYESLDDVVLETKSLMIGKAKKLGVEVIVDVRPSIAYTDVNYRVVYITGTALIPKKNNFKNKK